MQWTLRWVGTLGLVTASLLVPQVLPQAQAAARTAVPGMVNYVEGQVDINGNPLSPRQIGEARLEPDEVLTTSHGKAEVLLTPGVVMRVGNDSQVRLISNELVDPRVEVVRGEAMVEVDQKPKAAHLDILERGSDTSIEKEGLYRFDADSGTVAVVDGKVKVNVDSKSKELKKGHELALNAISDPVKFDTKKGDDLYRWSQLRSEYMAEANEASARTMYVNNGGGFGGGGWYWNPYFTSWAWLPGDGYFYSPFGYPFYSPGYVVYAPRVYSYPRGVNYPARTGVPVRQALPAARPQAQAFRGAGFRSGPVGGGFHGGGMAMGHGGRR